MCDFRGKSMAAITGTNGNDNGVSAPELIGTNDADTINGLDGDDVIEGLGGADIIDGGNGTDQVTYRNSPAGVVVSLLTGTGSGGDAAGDTFTNIENIEGSAFADTLTGDAGVNALGGGGGNDIIEGGAGADIIDGGGGTSDTASYAGSSAGVTVNLSTFSGFGGDAEGDQIYNTENILGSAHADNLTGDANANILTGAGGNDTLQGLGGNDTLIGGAGDDTAVFAGTRASATITNSSGTITVVSADGTDTLEEMEFLKFDDQTVKISDLFPSSSVIQVTTFNDVVDANDGVISLREAVTLANAAGKQMTIELGAGLYGLTADHGLDITGNVTLRGAGLSQTAIVNMGPRDSALHVNKGAVFDLADLNIYGGARASGPSLSHGGLLLNEGGNVSIHNSAFDSSALSSVIVSSSVNIANKFLPGVFVASAGGAIFNTGGGVMEIVGSVFSNNSAFSGGALAADSGYVSVDTSVFDGNKIYGDLAVPGTLPSVPKSGVVGASSEGANGLGAAIYSTGSARIDVYSNKASTGTPTTIVNHVVTTETNLPVSDPDATLVDGAIYLDPAIVVTGNTVQGLDGVTRATPFGGPTVSASASSARSQAFTADLQAAPGSPALLTLLKGLDLSFANADLALIANSILSQSATQVVVQLAGYRLVLTGDGLAFAGDPLSLFATSPDAAIAAAAGTINAITITNADGTATVGTVTGLSSSFQSVVTGLAKPKADGSFAPFAEVLGATVAQNGSDQADKLVGTANADVLNGKGGDDTLTGLGGNDIIDGGNGTDTAVFAGNRADYTVTRGSDGFYTVTDGTAARDGTDTIKYVEKLQFLDQTADINGTVSFTELIYGNTSQAKGIAALYETLLGGVPSIAGFSFLINGNLSSNFGAGYGPVFNDENIYINIGNALVQGNAAATTAFNALATGASVAEQVTSIYQAIIPASKQTAEGLAFITRPDGLKFYQDVALERGITTDNGPAIIALASLLKIAVDGKINVGNAVGDLVKSIADGSAALPDTSTLVLPIETVDGTKYDTDDAAALARISSPPAALTESYANSSEVSELALVSSMSIIGFADGHDGGWAG